MEKYKEICRKYEEMSNKNCLVRFMSFVNENCSKRDNERISKKYERFIEYIDKNKEICRISKNYLNFRDFLLNK